MQKQLFATIALGAAATLTLAACGGSSSAGSAGGSGSGSTKVGKVGVILPDTASSKRWEDSDRPAFQKAFQDAGITADIQNAQGDTSKFASIADGMIAEKVSVLIITSLDPDSGSAVIKKASAVGIPVIDYDRANLGGGAKYYVSFDNEKVGETIGTGLLSCLKAEKKTSGGIVELDGSPTDNNATLFHQGYDKVIKGGGYKVVAQQAVPDWDNTKGGQLFEQIFTKQKGKFVAVAAANDGLGGAVIAVLKRNGLAGKIPVSGQDATTEGLQRILLGTQCNSVFKPASLEVTAASDRKSVV